MLVFAAGIFRDVEVGESWLSRCTDPVVSDWKLRCQSDLLTLVGASQCHAEGIRTAGSECSNVNEWSTCDRVSGR